MEELTKLNEEELYSTGLKVEGMKGLKRKSDNIRRVRE